MGAELTKRTVSTGLGLGALGLLGGRAAADTRFSGFAFPATGTTAARTLPDRLAEIKNVKDFGAVGDGVADDWAAIQRAVNWTTGPDRGVIFFPPGVYKVGQPIGFNGLNGTTTEAPDLPWSPQNDVGPLSIIFQGCGDATTIVGNHNDYIFKRSNSNPTPGMRAVRDMHLVDAGMSTTGGIQMYGTLVGQISGIRTTTYRGVNMFQDTESVVVSHCRFGGGRVPGSFGVMLSNAGVAICCECIGHDHGIRTAGGATTIIGGRFENNNIGVAVGVGLDGLPHTASGYNIFGVSFESNLLAAIDVNGGSIGFISGCAVTANIGAPNPGETSECLRGIYLHGSSGTSIIGNSVAGRFKVAGIDMPSYGTTSIMSTRVNNASIQGGVNYLPEVNPGRVQFGGPFQKWAYSQLPAAAIEGDQYFITDAQIATFHGIVNQGGGSNRVWVRRNNNNQWIVVG